MPRSIYEDVSRTMGARDYHCDDPFKRIHWKASARSSQLQARQYESTASLNLLLVLDVHSFQQQGDESQEDFETAVSTAASLAYEVQREGSSVGLVANSVPELRIPVSAGRDNLLTILEGLARVQTHSRLPLQEYFTRDMTSLPPGSTILIITYILSPALTGMVKELGQRGHSVRLLAQRNSTPETDNPGFTPIQVKTAGNPPCRLPAMP